MHPIHLFFCLVTLFFQTFPSLSHSAQYYITDVAQYSIRRGPTTEHKILHFLQSGQPVKIMEQREGWSYIETLETNSQPASGWILTRYLMKRQPHETQVKLLLEENRILKEDGEKNQLRCSSSIQTLESLEQQLSEREQELSLTKNSLEQLTLDSADYLALRKQHEIQTQKYESIVKENTRLTSENQHKNLIIGGGLVFGGLFLGFLWGSREKKRSSRRFF